MDATQGVFISRTSQIQSGQPAMPCSCSTETRFCYSSVCGVATADRLNTVLNLLILKHADSIYKFAKCTKKKNHGARPKSLRFTWGWRSLGILHVVIHLGLRAQIQLNPVFLAWRSHWAVRVWGLGFPKPAQVVNRSRWNSFQTN